MTKKICEKFLSIDAYKIVGCLIISSFFMIISVLLGIGTLYNEEINSFWIGFLQGWILFLFCVGGACLLVFLEAFFTKIVKSLKLHCAKQHDLEYDSKRDY